MELTLNDIQEYLGQQGKKQGDEVVFQCGVCALSGGDAHSDNLKWNTKKNVLYCFKDSEHSKIILSEIMKKKHEEKKMSNVEIPKYLKCQDEYFMYQMFCNNVLLGNIDLDTLEEMERIGMLEENECDFYFNLINSDKPQKAREYLKQQRGINAHTISVTGLGIDLYKGKWVIPIYNMENNLVGFEYRHKNFKEKKIWRESGSPSCLAQIYGNGKKAIIHEGFLDSYCTVQMLIDKGIDKDYSIFTTSSGVSSTLKVLNELHFSKFDNIYLLLDNDEAGDKATEEIIKKYPFIIDMRDFLKKKGCKDVNEFMLKKG